MNIIRSAPKRQNGLTVDEAHALMAALGNVHVDLLPVTFQGGPDMGVFVSVVPREATMEAMARGERPDCSSVATVFRLNGSLGVMDHHNGLDGASGVYGDIAGAAAAIKLAFQAAANRMAA